MLFLLVILLIALAVLWRRVEALSARVDWLEGVDRIAARSAEALDRSTPARAVDVPVQPSPLPSPSPSTEPEPVPEPTSEPEPVSWSVRAVEPAPTSPTAAREEEPVPTASRGGFEEVFGRRLPIWAGGATLAVAGVLVVRYSIEAGLLSPLVRVVIGLLFGAGLIGAAEAALRREEAVRDPRVRQALAGAGVATLYACVLAAANLYALVGPATAFVGLAAVTVLAGGLSLRFGAPSAVLGLAGGLAAPALVGATQPDVPLLTLYLGVAVGGLCALARRQRWPWLGAAALAGGFGWSAALILDGAPGVVDAAAVGVYTLALAVALPLLVGGRPGGAVRLAGGLAGCAQIAALVALGGFAPLDWGLFGLLAAALTWLSRREAMLADAPILALGIAVPLMLAWPAPSAVGLALVLVGAALIVGVPTAMRVWRDDARATDAPLLAMLALATGIVPMIHDDPTGIPALIGAVGAATVAARGWRVAGRRDDARFATLTLTAAFLIALAATWTLPGWAWAPAVALVVPLLHRVARAAGDPRVERGGWVFAAAAVGLLGDGGDVARLFGLGTRGDAVDLVTWSVPALAFAAVALDRRGIAARPFAVAAALVGYGAAAQIVPPAWLPMVPAATVVVLAATRRERAVAALLAAAAVSVGWAAQPLADWMRHAVVAASGLFVAAGDWPSLPIAVVRLALPAAALAIAATRSPLDRWWRRALMGSAVVGGIVSAHLVVTHLFAIDTPARFVALAMPARFCWELLLAALALAAWRVGGRRGAAALGAASFLHLAWFTGLVANPLVVSQDAGPWLALSYALGAALLWAMPRALPGREVARDRLAMGLIVVAGFTLLRQASHAPMVLAAGTGAGEQIARSLLALALAGGFLWVGIRRDAREWRIASLALMLAAVAKVFLHDAAGLDGLARIASFAALGFSLIGVGWLYSRYLPAQDRSSLSATGSEQGE